MAHANRPPIGFLLTKEAGLCGIRPSVHVRTIVCRIVNDGIVGNTKLVQYREQLADMHIVLNHPVAILVLAGNALNLIFDVRTKLHPRSVPPDIERLILFMRSFDEIYGCGERFFIHRFHTKLGQRPIFEDILGTLDQGGDFATVTISNGLCESGAGLGDGDICEPRCTVDWRCEILRSSCGRDGLQL